MAGVLPSRCTLGMVLRFLSRALCWNLIWQSTYSCQTLAQELLRSPRKKWPTRLQIQDGVVPSSGELLRGDPGEGRLVLVSLVCFSVLVEKCVGETKSCYSVSEQS